MLNKKKNWYLSHSLSSMGPSVSVERALALASFKVSHIMGWFKSLNSFEKYTAALVLYGKWFKKLNWNILINIIINILFGGHPGRVFDPDLDLGQPE